MVVKVARVDFPFHYLLSHREVVVFIDIISNFFFFLIDYKRLGKRSMVEIRGFRFLTSPSFLQIVTVVSTRLLLAEFLILLNTSNSLRLHRDAFRGLR